MGISIYVVGRDGISIYVVGCDNARMLSWKCTKAHHTFNIRILNETFHCHASTASFWHQSTITLSLHPCLIN